MGLAKVACLVVLLVGSILSVSVCILFVCVCLFVALGRLVGWCFCAYAFVIPSRGFSNDVVVVFQVLFLFSVPFFFLHHHQQVVIRVR